VVRREVLLRQKDLTLAPLSAEEILRGWVEFHCPGHGGLCATTPAASVRCFCGSKARPVRYGRVLKSRDIKALQMGMSESRKRAA
jgi:hypothetical protein